MHPDISLTKYNKPAADLRVSGYLVLDLVSSKVSHNREFI